MFVTDDPKDSDTQSTATRDDVLPAAPDAGAAPLSEPSTAPDAGAPTATDGQPRDEHGRFTPKGTETPAPSGTLPDSGTPGASAGPSTAAPSIDNPPPSQTPPVEVQGTPLTYRAGGQERTYSGAERLPDGSIRIKPETYSQLANDLAAAYTYQHTWRDTLARTKAEAAQTAAEATTRATTLETMAGRLLEELEVRMEANEYRLLARELALDLKQAGVTPQQGTKPTAQPDPQQEQQQAEQIRFQAQQTLVDEVLTKIQHTPGYAALAPDEATRNDLLNYFLETMGTYYTEVDGQIVLDTHKVAFVLDREAKAVHARLEAQKKADAEVKALREAQERNAAKQKQPEIPPTIAPAGNTTPGKTPTTFKSRAEYDKWRAGYGLQ